MSSSLTRPLPTRKPRHSRPVISTDSSRHDDGTQPAHNQSSTHHVNDKENLHSQNIETPSDELSNNQITHCVRSPLSPIQNLVSHLRQRLEKQFQGAPPSPSQVAALSANNSQSHLVTSDEKVSPGLARLRSTPVGSLQERQRVLERKHRDAKSRSEQGSISVGGGVSLWPEMDNMRLTASEIHWLIASSTGLLLATVITVYWLHGEVWRSLGELTSRALEFPGRYKLVVFEDQDQFDVSVLAWHSHFTTLLSDIHSRFDVTMTDQPLIYHGCVALYVAGISILLFYLTDNVFSRAKLTPRRIKIWVSLLVVLGSWTLLMLLLLASAQRLERAIEQTVHSLSLHLSDLVYTDLDLTTFHNVLLLWRTECLPPTTQGTLSIMGWLGVRDVAHYLQYYSLPVITALLMPIVKLILSLKAIYTVNPHPS